MSCHDRNPLWSDSGPPVPAGEDGGGDLSGLDSILSTPLPPGPFHHGRPRRHRRDVKIRPDPTNNYLFSGSDPPTTIVSTSLPYSLSVCLLSTLGATPSPTLSPGSLLPSSLRPYSRYPSQVRVALLDPSPPTPSPSRVRLCVTPDPSRSSPRVLPDGVGLVDTTSTRVWTEVRDWKDPGNNHRHNPLVSRYGRILGGPPRPSRGFQVPPVDDCRTGLPSRPRPRGLADTESRETSRQTQSPDL